MNFPTLQPAPDFFDEVLYFLVDVWGTAWFGPDAEPTKVVYDGLGLQRHGVCLENHFLPVALTVKEPDPTVYLRTVAQFYGAAIPEHLYRDLEQVVSFEMGELMQGRILPKPVVHSIPAALPPSYSPNRAGMFEDVVPFLRRVKERRAGAGLCTNTWRLCDMRQVVRCYGVEQYFDHVLVSGEMGIAKQAGVEFFLQCAAIIKTLPVRCVAVDDNLLLGVVPAVQAGMRGVLIDRFRRYTDELGRSQTLPDGTPKYPEIEQYNILVIQSLDELLPAGRLGRSVRVA
jgi:FMN phosphatase YigB (HAD superfamily)